MTDWARRHLTRSLFPRFATSPAVHIRPKVLWRRIMPEVIARSATSGSSRWLVAGVSGRALRDASRYSLRKRNFSSFDTLAMSIDNTCAFGGIPVKGFRGTAQVEMGLPSLLRDGALTALLASRARPNCGYLHGNMSIMGK